MIRITVAKNSTFAVRHDNGDIACSFGNNREKLVKVFRTTSTVRSGVAVSATR